MSQSELPIPRIIGHRGLAAFAPENTLVGFRKAAELGIKWVEFDIQTTADGVLVVIHDETLNRTTNGRGPVIAQRYTDIAKLDACSWFKGSRAHEPVPTFEATIACLKQYQLGANIELKPCPGREEETTLKLLDALKTWPESLPLPLVSSFSLTCLRIARQHSSDLHLGLLMDHWCKDWETKYQELNCYSIHFHWRQLSLARLEQLRQRGARVLCYTVNDAFLAKTLWADGVTAVFSDCLV